MKRGIILINAYTKGESELNGPKRLAEELAFLGVQTEIRRNFLSAGIAETGAQNYLPEADFCIYLDKDKYAGELLERSGMRLFNRMQAIADCDDKMRTCIALSGFPVPKSIPAPLCYTQTPVDEAFLKNVAERLGFPLVVKECFGSLGKGVYKAENHAELKEIASALQMKPHLFQRFVAESSGRDLRVIVIGGKVFAAMLRTSAGDFRSNVELGGKGEPYELDRAAAELCERIASRLRLDYCGIDLLFGKDGFLVCEVNSNAFFGGIERVTGKNVARAYAEYIFREIY